jgi:Zn-dependent M28 family amino/carboxypeptidase
MAHTRYLVEEVGIRNSGSIGDQKAREYLSSVFGSLGLDVEEDPFVRVDGSRTANVIGRVPGANLSNGYLVVGAHFDTEPQTRGANDNASGTGVLLALAESFASSKIPVEFVAFGAEEFDYVNMTGLEGSKHYLANLEDPSQLKAMVSIDMVGNGLVARILRTDELSSGLQAEFLSLGREIGLSVASQMGGSLSDHATFTRVGIPAIHLWSGPHPTVHKPSDTMEVVQEVSVDRIGTLAHAWLQTRYGLSQ